MKIYILIILLFLSLTSFSQSDSLKTLKEYWENGQLKLISYYDDSYKQGIWQYFNTEGEKIEEIKYLNGNKSYWNKWENNIQIIKNGDGILTEYYNSNKIKAKGKIKEGKKYGDWIEYFPNGNIQNIIEYADWKGRYISELNFQYKLKKSFDSTGRLIGKNGTGLVIITDIEGNINKKIFYKENNQDSIYIYYPSGQIKEIKFIKDYLEYTKIEYYNNGVKKYSENNCGDTLVRITRYENNQIQEIFKQIDSTILNIGYYENGNKEFEKRCVQRQIFNVDELTETIKWNCSELFWNKEGYIENKP